MALNIFDTKFLDIAEIICEEGLSGIDKAVQIIINGAMLIERDRHLKAQRYERTPERISYANGFKPKQLKTRRWQILPIISLAGFTLRTCFKNIIG